MDLDASLKSLHTFKAKLERLFDGGLLDKLLEAAAAVEHSDLPSAADLFKRIDELAEHLAALEVKFDGLAPHLAAIEKLADPSVVELLDWLAGRREALDVLLSLGETADGMAQGTAGGPAGGGEPNSGGGTSGGGVGTWGTGVGTSGGGSGTTAPAGS